MLIAACGLQLAFNYGYFSRMKSEQWYKDAVVLPEVLHVADSTLKSFGLENMGKSMVPGFSSENGLKVEDVPAEAPAEKTETTDVPVEEEPVK